MKRYFFRIGIIVVLSMGFFLGDSHSAPYQGEFYAGEGDDHYVELLDIARRMFDPDPEFQNLSMMYHPAWNGLVEGPTWDAWWIQNSYGTTYSVLPFLEEPYLTFLQNSQDLWFDQMGDGKTVRPFKDFQWIPPDGCLCDAARPNWFIAKQGDGRVDIHDWGMEFTAAGLLMQAELLLISRDLEAIVHYLPKLERCADFLETRRDPENNLFLGGPASNLLAPSYAGYKKDDGTYDKAYLAGLSITTIAALDRMIELEKLAGNAEAVERYRQRQELARKGLPTLQTEEGYFVKSIDPDGTRHGVYGAAKHGYFEASPNHDAMAFRVVDDAQAEKIYQKIASIPGLRPHAFIIANCPGLDDMYTEPTDWLWSFGTWVNGGHWSTCEARMMLGYSRLGKYDDIRRSMEQLLTFARKFRMDNPLVEFGNQVYQPNQPINLCYDTFGPSAALIRGLFEYLYSAEGVVLIPHIPPTLTRFEQKFPIRLGEKRLFLSTQGSGEICRVWINGKDWPLFDARSITLPYDRLPSRAEIHLALGTTQDAAPVRLAASANRVEQSGQAELPEKPGLCDEGKLLYDMFRALGRQQLDGGYEAAHCRLGIECYETIGEREALNLPLLPEASQAAADQSYQDTARKVFDGFVQVMESYAESNNARERKIHQIWQEIFDPSKTGK